MGQNPGGTSATMDYVNLTSRGDGQSFGDALVSSNASIGCADSTRGVWAGTFSSPASTIQYTTIASGGGSINFGSMNEMKVDDTFELIASCIDQVYSEEESWSHQECTKKELSDFIESLNSNQFKMVEKFFETMPKLSHTVKVTNPNTKVESEIKIEGLQSFFA